MIKVAILDDDLTQINNTSKEINTILQDLNIAYSLDKFSTIKSLNEKLLEVKYDIYVLDIKIKDETSISLATKINNLNENGQIIFVTSFPDYFKDVYSSRHVYCLLKEEIGFRLKDALRKAIDNLGDKESKSLIIKTKHKATVIKTNDILYMEKSLRKIIFVLKDEKIETYGTFDDYMNKLPKYFMQVHRSYIINTNFIKNVSGTTITLLNNEIIPISRTYQKVVVEKIMNNYF